jgi:uncharacterized membrane protein YkvA (DUF1232 family)
MSEEIMNKIENNSTSGKEKRNFIISLVFLLAGVIYAIWPFDIIPDVIGPLGWVDDIGTLLIVSVMSYLSYRKMKKGEEEK